MDNTSASGGMLILGVALAMALLPVIVSSLRSASGFGFVAFLLCCAAAVASALVPTVFGNIISAIIWLAAFLCGLAGALVEAIRSAANGASYRLLENDARGLNPPDGMRRQTDLQSPALSDGMGRVAVCC